MLTFPNPISFPAKVKAYFSDAILTQVKRERENEFWITAYTDSVSGNYFLAVFTVLTVKQLSVTGYIELKL